MSATSSTSTTSSSSISSTNWLNHVEQHIREELSTPNSRQRPLLVGICGIPGSGKSVSSNLLYKALEDVGCMILPADGYHFRRDELTPEMMWRRGAPDTFDAQGLVRDLQRLRNGNEARILFPGFEHADGDPRPNQHEFVRAKHRVVICEGLYLLHKANGFESIDSLLDWTLFVDAPLDTCLDRLKERNRCIPGYEDDVVKLCRRIDSVDRVNAEIVQETRRRANFIVPVDEVLALQKQ